VNADVDSAERPRRPRLLARVEPLVCAKISSLKRLDAFLQIPKDDPD
jgi:hypothetical protein